MAKLKIKRQADFDFSESQLPHNRTEVFFDCLKLRWRTFLQLGLLFFFAMLPIFVVNIVRDNMIADAIYNGNSLLNARYTLLVFDAINIPFYLIAAIAFSAAFRVIRNIAWGEAVFFKEDTKDGIKLNWKVFSIVFVLIGTDVFFVDFIIQCTTIDIVKGIPIGISIMLLLPIAILIVVQATIYKIGFFGALKNACYLFAKSVWKSLLCALVTALPILFLLIPNTIVRNICLAAYMMFFMPYVCLGVFLCGCSLLDKYINAHSHPEIVDKGVNRVKNETEANEVASSEKEETAEIDCFENKNIDIQTNENEDVK